MTQDQRREDERRFVALVQPRDLRSRVIARIT